MNEKYLLALKDRYYNDKKFHEIVNRLAISLTLTDLSNDDIVRAVDMAVIVALDFLTKKDMEKDLAKELLEEYEPDRLN